MFRPEQYLINIPKLFAHHDSNAFHFVEGLAATIDQDNRVVRLVGRKEIPYDYLIIASGSTTQSTEGVDSDIVPWKARQNGQTLECVMESQKKIATAREIIICGAGPVGVEFAGELADVLRKDKKERRITLISATDRVLTQVNERVGCHAMTVLNRLGVEVSRGSRVISASHDTASARWIIKLDDGTVMSSDCYISTTGPVPNNKFVPDHFLDDQGWVKVDAHLVPSVLQLLGKVRAECMRLAISLHTNLGPCVPLASSCLYSWPLLKRIPKAHRLIVD